MSLSVFSLLLRPPPRPPLFPYTTLFRSEGRGGQGEHHYHRRRGRQEADRGSRQANPRADRRGDQRLRQGEAGRLFDLHADRTEEHTSELQSPDQLVCRLLLEKKKKNKTA